nr:CRISPR-associated endonuclease Cas2 [Ferrimicrobium acidiphilum]
MVYDIGERRVVKVLKAARIYLTWVQNSVFEGEITDANFMRLQNTLKRIIEPDDSILFYIFERLYRKKIVLGTNRAAPTNFF